jgi:predicted esterase
MTPSADLGYVHRFIPSSSDRTTLLLLHGTGGDENDLIPLGHELLPGAALLSLRGRVLENGMPRFFRRFAEGRFDLEDLKQQTTLLARFIREASQRYGLESGKLIAVGYSNGANIAGSLLLTEGDPLAGAVLFRPMVPFVPEKPPDLKNRPVLLSAGRRDAIVDPEQTLRMAKLLENAGANVSIHWHSGGHELGQDDLSAAKAWLLQLHNGR